MKLNELFDEYSDSTAQQSAQRNEQARKHSEAQRKVKHQPIADARTLEQEAAKLAKQWGAKVKRGK